MSSGNLTKLNDYVQTLADIPQQYSDPDAVVWPSFPEF
ncbi:phage tail assembly chaperone [Vibrio gazogenes]